MPTLVAELGVPLWATGQALGSHCSSRGAEKPPFPRKIEIWRDIGGGSHYFRRPQSYPITRPPPPSSLVQKKPRPDQVTFSVFAPISLRSLATIAVTRRRGSCASCMEEKTKRQNKEHDGHGPRLTGVASECYHEAAGEAALRHSGLQARRRPRHRCILVVVVAIVVVVTPRR